MVPSDADTDADFVHIKDVFRLDGVFLDLGLKPLEMVDDRSLVVSPLVFCGYGFLLAEVDVWVVLYPSRRLVVP